MALRAVQPGETVAKVKPPTVLSRRLDDIAKQIESITAARSQEDNERDSAPDEDWSTEAI